MKEKKKKEVKFIHCLITVLALIISMVYGLGIRSFVLHQNGFPVEMCLLLAITITAALLFYLGFSWDELLDGMIRKFSQGVGNYLIMLAIGVVIASWIISGTIPMLIYFGIKIINAQFIYVIAFIICCVFSVCTGTSWGSAGTIGVVLMGVGATIGASMPILAGAVVAGAIFGDKMSPLSDTTNLAAMAAEIDVYEHIRSMAYSTIPAALISAVLYVIMGFVAPPASLEFDVSIAQSSLDGIRAAFNFNPLLLLPAVLVVIGSVRKWPTVPTLIGSSLVALLLSMIFQQFSLGDAAGAMINGFKLDMLSWVPDAKNSSILSIFERGGLYSMSGTVIIGWMIFLYMGLAELIDAMPTFVNRVFVFAKSRVTIIFSTFAAALATLLVTGNGYAGTLISADVFKSKYDEYKIPRRILSRTLEDGTTMFDPMFSWGPTGMFMASTLGIATIQYMPFMFLTWANTGPDNVCVGGMESFDDLSEPAQKAVSAFYEKQGLLCDTQSELENAYAEYLTCKESGTEYHERYITQHIAPTAFNDSIMCFMTSVTLPVNGQTVQEICLGAAFNRQTGEVLNNWDLFTLPKEEARQWLLDAFQVDAALRAEMEAALKPEYIILFPENLEIIFPQGTLPSQDYSYGTSFEYHNLKSVLQPWAIPNDSVKSEIM